MKNKIIILVAFVSIFFQSCSDTESGLIEQKKEVLTFEDYFAFLNSDAKGTLLIQSLQTINSNTPIFSATSSILGSGTPFSLNINSTVINFTTPYYSLENNRSYANSDDQQFGLVYGASYASSLSNGQIVLTTDDNDPNLYIPELINISFEGLSEGGKVVEGTIINWNADSKNTNGTVIGFEYNPFIQTQQVLSQKTERLIKGSTQSDTGSYTVTADDLADFPNDANLTFYIGRAGNRDLINSSTGNKDFTIGAMTVSRADLQIEN